MENKHNVKLVKSNRIGIYSVSTQQFLKACISQNFVSNPNLILGETPRIICVDIESQTKNPIHYYFPLHKNYFMYFNKIIKLVNRQRLDNFLNFVLRNDIYQYENNIDSGVSIQNVREHINELLLDPSRLIAVYMLENCFAELLDIDCFEYIQRGFYGGIDQFQKSHIMKVPLFFNIVEKNQKINILGFLDNRKVNDVRLIPEDNYKFVRENTLEYFRQIVLKPIGEIFYYCPYVFPSSMLQYELLCQLYNIKPNNELMFYRYMFLLDSNFINRKCLYPLNFAVFERIDLDNLTSEELSLISDYYMIPIKKLKGNHLHFMPIAEVGRSVLILEQDVLLHKYTTDPPNNWDCIETYVYNEKE